MEQHLGNAASTTFSHRLRDPWKSPRGTVSRIEALAVVAIALSFLLAAFGSCRRWSNRWIVQKFFLAANVLSLSLGTYSIGLMQSLPVKSEMYPIWAVSLLTLFGCVDPVTTSYSGIDYKSPLSKMVFQLCLYCGYVLLMSISTISSDVGNIAITLLSVITFIKGFHRSLALVLQSRMRKAIMKHNSLRMRICPKGSVLTYEHWQMEPLIVHLPIETTDSQQITMREIYNEGEPIPGVHDVCMAFSMSHLLHQHVIGMKDIINSFSVEKTINYEWAMNLIKIELAFLYDINFTSNAFLHYYQLRIATVWAFVSLAGTCFVVVAAAIPGTMTGRHTFGPDACTIVVDTTTADFVITLIILVSITLLQLVQLMQCWTSNWARVDFACKFAWAKKIKMPKSWTWWMRFRRFLLSRINWSDNYLWRNQLNQYSVIEGSSSSKGMLFSSSSCSNSNNDGSSSDSHSRRRDSRVSSWSSLLYGKCVHLLGMLGFHYVGQVLWELLGSDTKGAAIRLDDEVKASIVEFLGQIRSDTIDSSWSSVLDALGRLALGEYENGFESSDVPLFPWAPGQVKEEGSTMVVLSQAMVFSSCAMMWHIATCYCELAELKQNQDAMMNQTEEEHTKCWETAATACFRKAIACFKRAASCFKSQKAATAGRGEAAEKNRHVAITLSKYCAYLIVSAPELLPGPSGDAQLVYDRTVSAAKDILHGTKSAKDKLEALRKEVEFDIDRDCPEIPMGVSLGKEIFDKTEGGCRWELLARFWVQTLLYAAPYGNREAHIQHLAQGGEFITHLWALLYHAGIEEWKPAEGDQRREFIFFEEEIPSPS
ncbi:hypothetical protein ACP70R_021869 [Stipagrostis hirtigluma subsp. patula]